MEEVIGDWRKVQWEASWFALFIKYYAFDQIKKDEMSRACSMYGGDKKYTLGVLVGKNKEDLLQYLGVEGV